MDLQQIKAYIKKNRSNIIWLALLALILIPQTGKPIKVFVNRLIAFAPSVEDAEDREVVDYGSWALVGNDGKVLNAADLKGKKVIVNFWATWCPPCVAEMPSLQKVYNDYAESAVFVLVSSEATETVQKFLSDNQYTLPVYRSLGGVPEKLQTNTLPTTYLINEKGEIVIRKVGSADWNSEKVRNLLDN